MPPLRLAAAGVAIALALATAGLAVRAGADVIAANSRVRPRFVHVGQVSTYTGQLVVSRTPPSDIRFSPADSTDALTWGPLGATRHGDTLIVSAEVQAFRLGNITVPGPVFADHADPHAQAYQMPEAQLTVVPVVPAGDTAADLHPVRGPLKAPWWEVVPWAWVIGISLAAGALVYALMKLRRRTVIEPAAPAARVDPADTALMRLRELRARRLPEAGQFDMHALELTSILRRFLEATTTRLRPGLTTSELTAPLKDESVPAEDALILVSLMRVWDRVKFARAPFTAEEARKSEDAVESFLKRRKQPPRTGVAA